MTSPTAVAKQAARAVLGDQAAHEARFRANEGAIGVRAHATARGRTTNRMLTACKDEFRGRRAVIIGNGPSLRDTDLSLLEGELTFGLNRVYLLFEELGFSTTFLVAINELLVSQVPEDLAAARSRKFIRWSCRDRFPVDAPIAFLQSRLRPAFSPDPRRGVWEGATVTHVAMQLAFHMGFREVVLVGVDHSFSTTGPANQAITSQGPDPNHFSPDYFGKGFMWQLPDLETSEMAYRLAGKAYADDGRSIVDATVGGRLHVFPKVSLRAALGRGQAATSP